MNRNTFKNRLLVPALVLGALGLLASGSAAAVTYYLCAGTISKLMPDGTLVSMWGFARVADSVAQEPGCGGTATVPGPKLTVPPGDGLTIELYNDLTGPGIEPISMVIPGQAVPAGSNPVFFFDTQGLQRVRSFVDETDPGSSGTYSWPNLVPGTYAYQSGTHPQVQVQMGLYGALTKDEAVGEAYPGVPYDTERDLFYSEIDPALHTAVADGSYGTNPTSTLDYVPKYFLINGEPYEVGDACIDGGLTQGDRILLRLYNEGLRELTPTMIGAHFEAVAEGGKPYPFAHRLYSVLLQPGSTKDLVFTPDHEGSFPIIDRRLNLTNPTMGVPLTAPGGFQTCLVAGASANPPPVAVADGYGPISLGGTLNEAAPGVLGNDTLNGATLTLSSGPSHASTFTLNADGSFSYTQNGDASASDSFVYELSNAGGTSQAAVTISVSLPAPPVPVATDDGYGPIEQGGSLNEAAPGVLGNDTLNGATLTLFSGPTHSSGFTLNADGSFSYTHNGDGSTSDSFVYELSNAGGTSQATVTIMVNPPAAASVHIGDLDGTSASVAGNPPNRWRAFVTATVHQQGETPVSGATVTGVWNAGDGNGVSTQCTTDGSGLCSVQSGRINGNNTASVSFLVTNVTATGATYQSTSNHDPDGDSNGTGITVTAP